MKKTIFLLLIIVTTLCITPLALGATNYTENDYIYTVTENKATITGCNTNLSGEIKIPEKLGGYPVTCIGESAFAGYGDITSVEIPQSVTSIEAFAFNSCLSLEKVILPSTTTDFGTGDAFYSCPKLLTAGPAGGSYNIEFNWTTHIPAEAFSGSNIETIILPSTITSIGNNAFFTCENLENINIPESVTDLGYQTFAYCYSLKSIEIPEGVTNLKGHVFRECTSLTYVKIPKSVTEAGSDNFSNCSKLLTAGPVGGGFNIEFSWDEEIPANSFNGSNISKIVIPEGVTLISENAFAYCGNLSDITLPSTIKSTQLSGLDDCYGITTAGPAEGNYNLKISCTDLTEEVMSTFVHLTDIVIPDCTTTIGYETFYGMKNLENVTFGENITSINANAFYGANSDVVLNVYEYSYAHKYAATQKKNCFLIDKNKRYYPDSALTISISDDNQATIIYCKGTTSGTVRISEEMYGFPIIAIADNAFSTCLKITDVEIPSSVKSIGSYAFQDCDALKEITIPDSVTSMGTFAFKSCNSLEKVTISDNITVLQTGIFHSCSSLKQVELPENLTTIGVNVFAKCSALENIYLPETITKIQGGAFSDCTSLAYIELPGNITAIEAGTFSNCQKLADIIIPDKVTSIGDSAFYKCYNFSKIIIPKSVTSIYGNAFVSCTNSFYVYSGTYGETYAAKKKHVIISETQNLYYYTIDDTVVVIGAKTKNLTNLDIEKELKNIDYTQIKIEYGAFRDNNGLKSITLPAEVSIIENKAFYGCSALSDVYFSGSKTKWNKIDTGTDNTALTTSTLNYSIPVETSISDDKKTVTISLENIENGKFVVLALYYNDTFVTSYSSVYQGENIVFNDVKETYDTVKVIVLNDPSSLNLLFPADLIV